MTGDLPECERACDGQRSGVVGGIGWSFAGPAVDSKILVHGY